MVRNVKKMVIFRVQIGGWAFIRAWGLIRDFTVIVFFHQVSKNIWLLMELVDSRFVHVWYTTDSVDSMDKTNGITPVILAA